jgi:hypothetical protein
VVKCIHQLPSLPPQPSANSRSCCTGNSFSWWLKVHLFIPMGLYKAAIEQVIQNHLLSTGAKRNRSLQKKDGSFLECQSLIPVKQYQTGYGMFSKKSFKLFIFVCFNMNLFLKIKKWIPLL